MRRRRGRQYWSAHDGVFEALEALFDALDLGFEKIPQVVEAFVHGVAQVVDASILEIHSKQVPADDDGDRPPLVELVHWIYSSLAMSTEPAGLRHRVD